MRYSYGNLSQQHKESNENEDKRELFETDVEDWLLKYTQHIGAIVTVTGNDQGENGNDTGSHSGHSIRLVAETQDDLARSNTDQLFQKHMEGGLLKRQEHATAVTTHDAITDNTASRSNVLHSAVVHRVPRDDGHPSDMNANVESVVGITTLARTPTLVIEGTKIKECASSSALWRIISFVLVVIGAIGATAALIVKDKSKSPTQLPTAWPTPPQKGSTGSSQNYTGNLNLTISQKLSLYQQEDFKVVTFIPCREAFIELFNRTDVNFTIFVVVPTVGETYLTQVNVDIIAKFIKPIWSGHTLDYLLSFTFEGILLSPENLYDGLVVNSMAGYPVVFRLNPTRFNNSTIVDTQEQYKNGVILHISGKHDQTLPWVSKSVYDILVETNLRRGDLSIFISLLDEVLDVKGVLQSSGADDATTLFAPTNEVLSKTLSNIRNISTFLRNHVVDGNVATKVWEVLPSVTKIDKTHFSIITYAQNVLILDMGQTNVTINGEATITTIIERDLFSQYGIVHVIDKPLF